MAIQFRRGAYADFNPTNMVEGEPAVVKSGDPNTSDGKSMYVSFATGSAKRIPTSDELDAAVTEINGDISDLQGDLATTQGNVTTLQGSVTTLQSNVSTLQGNVTTLQGNVTTLQGNVTTLQSDTNDLKQDYNQLSETKADKNSDNPEMGAGYAGQLVSSLRKSDSVPYNFRKVPYDATLEDGSIVGASVAWNQLFQNGNFGNGTAGWTISGGSGETASNVLTLVGNRANPYVGQYVTRVENHKYVCLAQAKQDENGNMYISAQNTGLIYNTENAVGSWVQLHLMFSASASDNKLVLFDPHAKTSGDKLYLRNFMLFDITQMLGTTIADYVYSLETATAGSGVAWLKEHFPKQFDSGYQAYNAGEIKSISGLAVHKSVGFNAFDKSKATLGKRVNYDGTVGNDSRYFASDYIRVVGNTNYYLKDVVGANGWYAIVYFDAEKNNVGYANISGDGKVSGLVLVPDGASYARINGLVENIDTICINISKPTGTPKNGDYVPYESHTYALDSTKTLRGILKLDSNNKLYADGDRYLADGTVERTWGEVDLGSLDWESLSSPSSHIFRAPLVDAKPSSTTQTAQNDPANAMMSNGYEAKGFTPISASDDKHFAIGFATGLDTMRLVVIDLSQSSTSSFKTAMTGVHLVYEKMTATTETALPYGNPQVIDPDGTESYVYTDGAFELPVGHTSEYPVNVSGQLDDILDTPSANGTYTLQATVTDGAVSYEWVSAT